MKARASSGATPPVRLTPREDTSPPEDFAAFILTHGRPRRVLTYRMLLRVGYSGPVYFVVDDEDPTLEEYREVFGADRVLTFSKAAVAETFDEGDNTEDRRAVVYARNACWDLARQVGVRYFVQLDDDYDWLRYSFDGQWRVWWRWVHSADAVFAAMRDFLRDSGAAAVALAQTGDRVGGLDSSRFRSIFAWRKAMNTFFCDAQRPFPFLGRINEDVNTYVTLGSRGLLFLTVNLVAINQADTQQQPGGMTDLYRDSGTYVKSFYSVMYAPSSVRVTLIGDLHRRLHHRVDWPTAVPVILSDRHRKAQGF